MVEFIPYTNRVSDDLNDLYEFTAKGKTKPFYKVSIEIDNFADGILVETLCQCNNFKMKGGRCKHILAAMDILSANGITWVEKKEEKKDGQD